MSNRNGLISTPGVFYTGDPNSSIYIPKGGDIIVNSIDVQNATVENQIVLDGQTLTAQNDTLLINGTPVGGSGQVGTLAQVLIQGSSAGASAINMNSNKITSLATPTVATDASSKGYVDSAIATAIASAPFLPTAGGTMSGNINLAGNQLTNVGSLATGTITSGSGTVSIPANINSTGQTVTCGSVVTNTIPGTAGNALTLGANASGVTVSKPISMGANGITSTGTISATVIDGATVTTNNIPGNNGINLNLGANAVGINIRKNVNMDGNDINNVNDINMTGLGATITNAGGTLNISALGTTINSLGSCAINSANAVGFSSSVEKFKMKDNTMSSYNGTTLTFQDVASLSEPGGNTVFMNDNNSRIKIQSSAGIDTTGSVYLPSGSNVYINNVPISGAIPPTLPFCTSATLDLTTSTYTISATDANKAYFVTSSNNTPACTITFPTSTNVPALQNAYITFYFGTSTVVNFTNPIALGPLCTTFNAGDSCIVQFFSAPNGASPPVNFASPNFISLVRSQGFNASGPFAITSQKILGPTALYNVGPSDINQAYAFIQSANPPVGTGIIQIPGAPTAPVWNNSYLVIYNAGAQTGSTQPKLQVQSTGGSALPINVTLNYRDSIIIQYGWSPLSSAYIPLIIGSNKYQAPALADVLESGKTTGAYDIVMGDGTPEGKANLLNTGTAEIVTLKVNEIQPVLLEFPDIGFIGNLVFPDVAGAGAIRNIATLQGLVDTPISVTSQLNMNGNAVYSGENNPLSVNAYDILSLQANNSIKLVGNNSDELMNMDGTVINAYKPLDMNQQPINNCPTIATIQSQIQQGNQEILALQGDVTTLQGQVATINGEITTIQGDVTTLQGQVTTLQGDVTTLQGEVVTLQGDVTTLQGEVATNTTDIATLQTDKLNKSSALYVNSYYVNDGVNDIQTVIDTIGAEQGNVIYMGCGSYGGSTVLISQANNLMINGPGAGGNPATICELANGRGLTITSGAQRIRINNLSIKGALTLGAQGNNYFQSCSVAQGLTISSGTTGNFYFYDCEFSGAITVPSTFAGGIAFIRCNFNGATFSLNNVLPQQVQFTQALNLIATYPLKALYGGTNQLSSGAVFEGVNVVQPVGATSFSTVGCSTLGSSLSYNSATGALSLLPQSGSALSTVTISPGGSAGFFEYNANLASVNPPPGNGNIRWNASNQLIATQLYVSHLTRQNQDIDVFLEEIKQGNTIILQDQNDSSVYQKWVISGTPSTVTNSYWTFPVTLVSGLASSSFTAGQQIALISLSTSPSGVQSVTAGNGITLGGTATDPVVNANVVDIQAGTNISITNANGTYYINGSAPTLAQVMNQGADAPTDLNMTGHNIINCNIVYSQTFQGTLDGNATTATSATTADSASAVSTASPGLLYNPNNYTTNPVTNGTEGQVLTMVSGVPAFQDPAVQPTPTLAQVLDSSPVANQAIDMAGYNVNAVGTLNATDVYATTFHGDLDGVASSANNVNTSKLGILNNVPSGTRVITNNYVDGQVLTWKGMAEGGASWEYPALTTVVSGNSGISVVEGPALNYAVSNNGVIQITQGTGITISGTKSNYTISANKQTLTLGDVMFNENIASTYLDMNQYNITNAGAITVGTVNATFINGTVSEANFATTAGTATNANFATNAQQADVATTAGTANNAGYATQAGSAITAGKSDFTDTVNGAKGIIYNTGTNITGRISDGGNSQVLTMVAGEPAWANAPSATVPTLGQVMLQGAVASDALNMNSNDITNAGQVTAVKFIGPLNGLASIARNIQRPQGMLYNSSTNTTDSLAYGTENQLLSIVGGVPAWSDNPNPTPTTVSAGTNVTVTQPTPGNYVVSATGGGGGGGVNSVVAGAGISVDNTDPANPVVSSTVVTPGLAQVLAESSDAQGYDMIALGSVTANAFVGNVQGNLSGTASKASTVALNTGILYNSQQDITTRLAPGTTGQILSQGGAGVAPQWVNQSTLSVGQASLATNKNGPAGSVLYQSALNTTSILGAGSVNDILTQGASTPVFASPSTVTVGGATNVQQTEGIIYNSGTNTSASLAPTTAGRLLQTNGAGVAPSWVDPTTLTVSSATTATNASNVAITTKGDNVTYYPTFVANTTGNNAEYVDADMNYNPSTNTLTVPNITGNASTATRATNIAGGLANRVPYQTGAGATTFTNTPSAGNILVASATGVPTWQSGASIPTAVISIPAPNTFYSNQNQTIVTGTQWCKASVAQDGVYGFTPVTNTPTIICDVYFNLLTATWRNSTDQYLTLQLSQSQTAGGTFTTIGNPYPVTFAPASVNATTSRAQCRIIVGGTGNGFTAGNTYYFGFACGTTGNASATNIASVPSAVVFTCYY